MPLRQLIRGAVAELFEAIPERIEVSGHAPTWRVTGGSFEDVLDYVAEAHAGAVVVAREDHARWWPRVTLTVTTDPALLATAPPLDAFADPEPEPVPEPEPEPEPAPEPAVEPDAAPAGRAIEDAPTGDSTLEQMFAYQEDLRRRRLGIPRQRGEGARPEQ